MAESIIIWLADDADGPSARHRYVAQLVFEVILGCPHHWASDRSDWLASPHRKVQYGGTRDEGSANRIAWIPSAGLLSETGTAVPPWIWSDATPEATPGATRLPFGVRSQSDADEIVFSDWWSWAFWMTTCLDDFRFSSTDRDAFGRLEGRKSWAHREGWLERPEVEFRAIAWAKSNGIAFTPSVYRVIPTVDVDSAFAYKHRSPFMTFAAAAQDGVKGRWSRFRDRIQVLRGIQEDAYDTYDWLEQQHREAGMKATYFFLLANRGRYDRGVSWKSHGLQMRIRSLHTSANVGIHPGFAAHESTSSLTMQNEIKRLEEITGESVVRARQHYLLQRPESSWKRLEALGIQQDHSLGYADVPGFRGGMSRAYPAYDVESERTMNLELHPVGAMDATFMRYLQVSPEMAIDHVVALSNAVREVGGTMRLLWHNESVSDTGEWKGWRLMYKEMLKRIR